MLDKSVERDERKNLEIEVLAKLAKLTHQQLDLDQLSDTLVRNICQLIGYDRSILLTINSEKNTLNVTAFYGFDDEMAELLDQTSFNIRSDNDSGWLIRVVNSRKPVFIQDTQKEIHRLSGRSKAFTKYMKSASFIAVPLFDKNDKVTGVLAIDNIDATKLLTIEDQELLTKVGDHLGIAIENSKLLSQLKNSLETTERYSLKESYLKEVFKKFIPTQMANQLMEGQNERPGSDIIDRVKKQQVASLFLDLFGFSTISETMKAERVIEFLNIIYRRIEPDHSARGRLRG